MKHTPGPWRILTSSVSSSYVITSLNDIGNDMPVALVGNAYDANLIANAPDLLESLELATAKLEEIKQTVGIPNELLTKCSDVIKKVKG